MKITANRKDDILKQKSEYEKVFSERKKRYDQQKDDFEEAEYNVISQVVNNIENQLTHYHSLYFDVRGMRNYNGTGVELRILCNENNKFDDNVALSWNYDVSLSEDGTVNRETSSWSGLKAVTPEQIQSLEETLEAIKYLNSIDWKQVIGVELPHYKDYVTESDPRYDKDKPNFDRLLLDADLEDMIGTRKAIRRNGGSKFYRGTVYSIIVDETRAQYTIFDIPNSAVNDDKEQTYYRYHDDTYRISKDKFVSSISKPTEIIELD